MPRPKLPANEKRRMTSMKIKPALLDALARAAEADGVSQASIIEELLTRHLTRRGFLGKDQ